MADQTRYSDRHNKLGDLFLYMHTSKEHRGHTNHYVKVWRVHDNMLTLVGTMYYHHMDTDQAVCELLAAKLPSEFGAADKMQLAMTLNLVQLTPPNTKEIDHISA